MSFEDTKTNGTNEGRISQSQKTPEPCSNDYEQPADEYAELRAFESNQWLDWINAFIALTPIAPFVPVTNEEPHQTLIAIYNSLENKTSRDMFSRAVLRIYESTPAIPQNAPQVFYLLHLIAYAIPMGGGELLRRRLYDRTLRNMEYGFENLETLLLIAGSKYQVDDDLVEYIQRTSRVSTRMDYLTAGLRVLSTRGGKEAYPFIEKLLPRMQSESDVAQVMRQLTSITERVGYKEFLEWYRTGANKLSARFPTQWRLFEWGLKERLVTDLNLHNWAIIDSYSVLFYGELRAVHHRDFNHIPPHVIRTIAGLYAQIGEEETVSILFDLWENMFNTWGESPWDYVSSGELRRVDNSGNGAIVNEIRKRYEREVRSQVLIDARGEPELEAVLLGVRALYGTLIARTGSARAG